MHGQADGPRGARLRRAAAAAARHERRGARRDRRPRRWSELALDEHADTRIESLSGGQRKRVGLAAELLGPAEPAVPRRADDRPRPRPRDAHDGAARASLADDSRAVVVVTHATKNLGVLPEADRDGARRRAVLRRLAGRRAGVLRRRRPTTTSTPRSTSRPATEWRRSAFAGAAAQRPSMPAGAPRAGRAAATAGGRRRRAVAASRQAAVLTRRYVQLFMRDRRNLLILHRPGARCWRWRSSACSRWTCSPSATTAGRGRQAAVPRRHDGDLVRLDRLGAGDRQGEGACTSARPRSACASSAYLFSKAAVLFTLAALQTVVLAGDRVLLPAACTRRAGRTRLVVGHAAPDARSRRSAMGLADVGRGAHAGPGDELHPARC